MKKCGRIITVIIMVLVFPNVLFGQNSGGFADEVKSLHQVLEQLYTEMMPLCSKLMESAGV